MSITKPYIIGASVTGPLHIQTGLPCQDACCYEVLSDNYGVLAVADGLGSAPMSKLGSRISVEAAVNIAKKLLEQTPKDQIDISGLPRRMIYSARESLEEAALREGCPLSDLATTLITGVFYRNCLYAAQIGDGAVVARVDGVLKLLITPGNSEYANEVSPLTCREWIENLYVSEGYSGVEYAAVFTDGCQRSALLKTASGYEPFDKFFNPVFSYAANINDIEEGEEELKTFLSSEKIREHSEDDKTLILAVLESQTE